MVAKCSGGGKGDGGGCRVVRGRAGGDEEGLKFRAGGFEVGDIDENLDDLAKVLRGQFGYEGGTDFGCEEIVEGGFQTIVNDFGVLEVGGNEEVELVEEVADVDAAEWVHLGEGKHAGEDHFGDGPVWSVPADVDDLFVLLRVLNRHGHVVVCGDDLEEVVTEAAFEELCVFVK